MSLFPYGYVSNAGGQPGPMGPRGPPGVQGPAGQNGSDGTGFYGNYTGAVNFYSEEFNIRDISTNEGPCFNVLDDNGNPIISALNVIGEGDQQILAVISQNHIVNGFSRVVPTNAVYPFPFDTPTFSVEKRNFDEGNELTVATFSDGLVKMNVANESSSLRLSNSNVDIVGRTSILASPFNTKVLECISADDETRLEVNQQTQEIYLGYDLQRRVPECDIGKSDSPFTNIYGSTINGFTINGNKLSMVASSSDSKPVDIKSSDNETRFEINQETGDIYLGYNLLKRVAECNLGSTISPFSNVYATNLYGTSFIGSTINGVNITTERLQSSTGVFNISATDDARITNVFRVQNRFNPLINVLSANTLNSGVGNVLITGDLGISGNIIPSSTSYNLGNNSNFSRWGNIYLVNQPNVSSSRAIKDDIQPLSYGLEYLKKLKPQQYTLKSDESKEIHWGFVVEEVEECTPVETAFLQDGGLQYCELISPLVKSVQELDEKISKCKTASMSPSMKSRLDGIEKQQQDIMSQLGSINARLHMMETRIKSLDPETRSIS